MTGIQQLEPLQSMARCNADQAARDLGQALARKAQLDRQMAELVRYRADYREELRRAMSQSLRIDQAQAYRNLLERLDGAIERQQALLDTQVTACEQARHRYLDRQARLQAFDQLIQTRRKAEQVRQAVREQHLLDDLTQSRWRLARSMS